MYKVGDMFVYKKDVCVVREKKEKYFKDKDYYVLTPLTDDSLKINIPADSKDIRDLLTKEEVEEIIKKMKNIEPIKSDAKNLENEYKQLMQRGTHEDLIKIIKTTYLRNKERLDNNKKTTDKDNYYFNQAELYLYNEFSVVLGLTVPKTKDYLIKTLEEA